LRRTLCVNWACRRCCAHTLIIEKDRIKDYRLRIPDQKRQAVAAFKRLNYRVIAAGDSFNDTTMLAEADAGFLFHAPTNVIAQFPQFPAVHEFDELFALITQAARQE
jgi:phosphoserine/homoserine phosphotransferase